jgi:predicted ribosomally synthesized peptide with nif11-like leader
MSAEEAKKFVDHVNSDPQLQEEVKNYQGNLVGLAAQNGYSITQEELQDELRARWGSDQLEDPAQCTHTDWA